MPFLLCTNKVIFSSGFCPAVSDVRSGSEEEMLHSAHEGSDGEGEGPPRWVVGCLSLGFTGQMFETMPW